MATRHIVSVKAVIRAREGLILLKNERDEWELPGGQLEAREEPAACVVREVKEELGIDVKVDRLLSTWQFEPVPACYVLIIAYGCTAIDANTTLRLSHEHKELGCFQLQDLDSIRLPSGYLDAIRIATSI